MQYKFIVESYSDPQQTLWQAIEIPCTGTTEEFHRNRAFYRTQINPNLTWLRTIRYLDENRQILYSEEYDIDGNLIKRDEPWPFSSNKNKYSKGGEVR